MITLHYAADLRAGIFQTRMPMLFASGDQNAHEIRVTVTEDGQPVSLTGKTVSGYFIRADRSTVLLSGSAEGNVASVTLSQSCYVQPGGFSLFIKAGTAGETAATFWGVGTVVRSTTDTIVDPSETIPSMEELLAMIGAMETVTTAAQSATSAANTAAGAANTAAGQATTAASTASTAAGQATTAAGNANTAAGAANTAAQTANTAAQKIDGMTVSATGLTAGSSPTVVISEQDGAKHIAFGIPKGDKGDKGDTGATPEITIGTVTTGAPGTDASATITGTPEAPVLNFQIPRGNPGAVQTVNGNAPDEQGNAQVDGLIYPTTAQELEAMSQEQQAALYAQGYRAIVVTYNETTTMHALEEDGSLAWVGNIPDSLLINGNFAVAQAGYGGKHGTKVYVADMWTEPFNKGTYSWASPGIVMAYGTGNAYCRQILSNPPVEGTQITIAAETDEHGIVIVTGAYSATEVINKQVGSFYVQLFEGMVQLIVTSGSVTVRNVRFLIGNYTLKTLPPWVAPDPVAELIKCQRFYWSLKSTQYKTLGLGYEGPSYAFLVVGLPVPMRTDAPTLVQSSPINLGNRAYTFDSCDVVGSQAVIDVNYTAISDPVGGIYGYAAGAEGVTLEFCDDL